MIDIFSAEVNQRNIPPERIKAMQEAFIQGWGSVPLVGTKEQVVDGLTALSRAGLDGVLVVFPRYESGMREFRDVTYPLLRQAGLREFVG
jgi:alkanesulfonate monooxygenase SsuD/methylene tetrahydromethanopterin reductase-like flavin-dependent oxidoreductase (luciferase family)